MSVFSQFKFKDLLVDAVIQQCPAQQELGTCTPTLDFSFDHGGVVSLRFPSPVALLDFCREHNFPVEDYRLKNFQIPKGSDYGKQGMWIGGFDNGVKAYLDHFLNGVPMPKLDATKSWSKHGYNGFHRGVSVMKEIINNSEVNHGA